MLPVNTLQNFITMVTAQTVMVLLFNVVHMMPAALIIYLFLGMAMVTVRET